MDDSTSKPKGGILLAAARRHRRKQNLEEYLRKSVSLEDHRSPPRGSEAGKGKQKLFDAIREIAIPALDELQKEKAKRSSLTTPPPIFAPLAKAVVLEPPSQQARKNIFSTSSMLNVPSPTALSNPDLSGGERGFEHNDNYQVIIYNGKEYRLTELAGLIVELLYQDHLANRAGVSFAMIKRRTQCGKVWDAFRKRSGREFWNDLIEKCEKDLLRLRLDR